MSEVKSGWKTTEFWLSVAATVVGLVMFILGSTLPEGHLALQVVGSIATFLASIGYTAGRSLVKSTELKASAVKESALAVEKK